MAAAAYTLTTLVDMLKEQYTDETVALMGYRDNPLLGMIDKDEGLGGEYFVLPIGYGHTRHSSSFATAVAQRSTIKTKQWQVTTVNDYAVAEIDRKTKLMARAGNTSFLEAVKTAVDDAVYGITRSLAAGLYGAASGSIGKILSGSITSNTFTLAEINDIVNFEVGQRIDSFTALSGGAAHLAGAEITNVDRDLGTITVDAIGTAANNDFLFNESDRGSKLSGLAGWIPSTAPGATAFFGVDRTADVTRLAGVRVTLTGLPIEEGLLKLITQVSRNGGRPKWIMLNDLRWTELAIALGSKVVRDIVKSTSGDVGFDAIQMHGPKGIVSVIGDANCPYGLAYCLTPETLKLRSVMPAPHIFDLDSPQELLRYASADSYELRVGYYAQMTVNAPGKNGVGTF